MLMERRHRDSLLPRALLPFILLLGALFFPGSVAGEGMGADSAGGAQVPSPLLEPADTSGIEGRVLDGLRGDAPVAGALVRLDLSERVTRTNGDGQFYFDDVPAGEWTLHTRVEGMQPVRTRIRVQGGEGGPTEVEVTLTERLFELQAVVASLSPLRSPVGYQPAQALDREELARRLGTSVGTMLDGEPGVAMRSLGPAPARPVIRGFDGDRVLVLENGERMGDLAETAADHALSLDPLSLRRVEVVRGPASLLYGASALGGVVNLLTGDIPESWARGWSGSMATQGATVNRSGALSGDAVLGGDEWAGTGRLSLRKTGDLRTPEARLPGTGVTSLDGQVGGVWERGGLRMGVSLSFLDREYGIPEALEDEDQEMVVTMDRQALQSRLDWAPVQPGVVHGVDIRLNAVRYLQQELERAYGNVSPEEAAGGARDGPRGLRRLLQEDLELEFQQLSASGTATLRHGPLGPMNGGAVGLALRGRKVEVGGEEAFTPGTRGGTVGIFTFQEIPLGVGTRLQLGLRGEGQRSRPLQNLDAAPHPNQDPRETHRQDLRPGDGARASLTLSGSAGLNWRPAPGWEVGGQLARAHRNPSVEELFAHGPHLAAGAYEIGDPKLRDEIGHGVDLFLRHGSDRLTFELAAFFNRISGFVAFQPTGRVDEGSGLPVFQYEATNARMFGGEATLSAQVTTMTRAAVGVDYVRGDRIGSGSAASPLPTIPPLRGRLDLRHDPGPGWVGVTLRAVSAQNRVAEEEDTTDGYVLLDVDAGLRIDPSGRHSVILRVENSTNRLYRDHLSRVEERGFPMPARNLSLVYRVRF